MKLHISGGRHALTDIDGRIEALETALDAPELVFQEQRPDDQTWHEKARNWFAAPLLLIGITGYLRLLGVIATILPSDDEIADHVVDTYEVETRGVDKPLHDILSAQRQTWTVANWALIAVPALFLIVNPTAIMAVVAGTLLLFGLASVMMAFLAAVHAERNVYMMNCIADIAQAEDLDEACLITGGKHDAELRNLARRYEGIDLVEDVDSQRSTQTNERATQRPPTH